MTLFILFSIGMVLVALLMLLPVLFRSSAGEEQQTRLANVEVARDSLKQLDAQRVVQAMTDDEYNLRRTEIERELALNLGEDDVTTAQPEGKLPLYAGGATILSIPFVAVALYMSTGKPEAMNPEYIQAAQQPVTQNNQVASIEELLPRLENHLAQNPEDADGWRLLGVTYLRMQRYDDAVQALRRASDLTPDDADLLFQLVDASAMSAGGRIDEQGSQWLQRASALAPMDPRGLWLTGMLHRQQGDDAAALETWQTLLPLLADQPQARTEIERLIAQVSADVSGSVEDGTAGSQDDVTGLSVTVTAAAEVLDGVTKDTAVYVYARAQSGPPMPLAVVKRTVGDLPLQLRLDDSMAMMPQLKLSQFDRVVVGARVSFSGDPIAQPGDLFGEMQDIALPSDQPVQITIADIVPPRAQ